MSKVLYPKKTVPSGTVRPQEPYVVVFSDPSGELPDEVRSFPSEMGAKAAAWYHCRLVGFRTAAVLYTREEYDELVSAR